MGLALLRLGETLFRHCYPVYVPVYAAYKAFHDRDERAALRRLVRPGMTVADVGANIGLYTRFLAKLVGGSGHVYAFEPSPVNYARMTRQVAKLSNVTTVQSAVGEHAGTTSLFLSPDFNIDHRTFDTHEGRESIELPVITLDDYFRDRRVDFIKVDVQGAEHAVLRGAARLIQDNPAMRLLIEFWPYGLRQAGTEPSALLDFIKSLGLDVSRVGADDDGSLLEATRRTDYCNLLLSKA